MIRKGPASRRYDGQLMHGQKHLDCLSQTDYASGGERLLLLWVEVAVSSERWSAGHGHNKRGVKADCKVLQAVECCLAFVLVPHVGTASCAEGFDRITVVDNLLVCCRSHGVGVETP